MNSQQPPTLDRISDLPWDVLDNILGNLPIKTVVSTSVLSKKWRYVWIDVSKLLFVLGSKNWEESYLDASHVVTKIVYQVLLSHRGAQIDKFLFQPNLRWYEHPDHFDSWILLLGRKGIKDLAFNSDKRISSYELPAHLFLCQTLEHLHLSYCNVVLPPRTFECFGNLVSLELVDFTDYDDGPLESLIRGCPVLERLVLLRFEKYLGGLKIDAPRLKYLHVEGGFKDIYIAKAPLLEVCFKMTSETQGSMVPDLVGPLWCFSRVKKLALSGYFLKVCCVSSPNPMKRGGDALFYSYRATVSLVFLFFP